MKTHNTTFKKMRFAQVICLKPHTTFTFNRGTRLYEYIGTVTDDNYLYPLDIAVIYNASTGKYEAINVYRDKRASHVINVHI